MCADRRRAFGKAVSSRNPALNVAVESLEFRCHLSVSTKVVRAPKPPAVHPIAQPHYLSPGKHAVTSKGVVTPFYAGSSTPYGKTPTVIRSAYGLGTYGASPITFNGIQGDGTGQTIAIVDAYDYPTASFDLNAFSSYFGLPTLTSNTSSLAAINSASGPTFSKISQSGSFTSLPTTDPNGPYQTTGGSTWEQEASLDIEWAHVMAPKANIVLVEGTDSTTLFSAVQFARTIPGVVAVSMSFGSEEFSGESAYDSIFTTPSGHQGGAASAGAPLITGGVVFLASTGDSGAYGTTSATQTTFTPSFPAISPNVVAVGGTHLNTSGNSYVSETAWGNGSTSGTQGGGGGGVSLYNVQPAFQSGVVSAYSTTNRTIPDLSLEADPATGVPIYDSWDFGTSTPWIPGYEGGTSLSCPLMAGIVAVADQGRAINGVGSLYGNQAGSGNVAGILQNIYSIPSADYHDVTSGSNGYSAVAGYDLATGRGSPIAGTFVRDVAALPSTYTASGTVFVDKNDDGAFSGSDTGLAIVTVYADVNGNGSYDSATDIATTSGSGGVFTLSGISTGTAIREVLPAGYVATTGAAAGTVSGANLTGLLLGNFPITFGGTNANAAYAWTLSLDATGTKEQIVQTLAGANVQNYSVAKSLLTTLTFTSGNFDDVVTLDLTNGNPLLAGGISFTAGAQAAADTLAIIGAPSSGAVTFGNGVVTFAGRSLTYTGVEALTYTGNSGSDNVNVTSNTLPFAFAGNGGTDTLNITGGTFAPTADLNAGGSSVTLIRTGGTTTFATSQHLASLNLLSGATATFTGANTVLRTSNLTVDTAGGSTLDLGTAGLIYDYTTASPSAAVTTLLASGYAGGAWTGLGIRSSAAAADASKNHTIGYAEAATAFGISGAQTTSFLGETVDATTYVTRYTLYGDINLNASVTIVDFNVFAANFGQVGGATWSLGDFNFDGSVTIVDFNKLAATFGLFA